MLSRLLSLIPVELQYNFRDVDQNALKKRNKDFVSRESSEEVASLLFLISELSENFDQLPLQTAKGILPGTRKMFREFNSMDLKVVSAKVSDFSGDRHSSLVVCIAFNRNGELFTCTYRDSSTHPFYFKEVKEKMRRSQWTRSTLVIAPEGEELALTRFVSAMDPKDFKHWELSDINLCGIHIEELKEILVQVKHRVEENRSVKRGLS